MSHRSSFISRAALLAATAVVSLVFGSAFAEDAVLLASTVPGYMPGMVVSSTDRLSVPEGASATLLFRSGEMMRLGGPFEGTLEQEQGKAGSNSVALLADLFRLHGIDATMIGGTRSTSVARSPTLIEDVQVDAHRSGTYCIEPSTSVWLTRPAGDQRVYAVRRKGSSRTLGWPAEAARVEWPADVPIEDGSQFEIAADGTARATVTFRAMPSTTAGPAAVATGILLGCQDQFSDELRRIGRAATRPEIWVTSDRGRRPRYHQGEPVMLTVMSDTDGFLYCVAASEDGSATPIFPAGAVDGAQIHGAVALTIPGRRQPVGLTATPGLEQIRCWLADRDITPELPHALLGTPNGRIPDQLAADLNGLFSRVGGTRLESDVLTVRTE